MFFIRKWASDHPLPDLGGTICTSLFTQVERRVTRRYLSDASFGVVGGYCPELKIV